MNYRLRLTKKAEQVRLLANPVLQKKLVKCFTILQESPKSNPQIKPLKGEFAGKYRFRLGDYRVIYTVNDEERQVIILLIEHRSQSYR